MIIMQAAYGWRIDGRKSARTVLSLSNCDLIGVGNKARTQKALSKGELL